MKKTKTVLTKLREIKTGIVGGIILVSMYSCSDNSSTGSTTSPENSSNNNVVSEQTTEIDSMTNKGIGPVQNVTLGEINVELVKKGEELFNGKCSACHKMDSKVVGPALAGVTKRRTPEWIMNMILNPNEMTQQDPIAKRLLGQYATAMANQSLTEDEARAILEYFRNYDNKQ
ncbi:MAG: hypothetical protein KatS3mg027_0414 [Bacteroidia bacterium]|nr:MAG: hypothetical protein KatS3mg027_0414 [Bacteroidia bacterium]